MNFLSQVMDTMDCLYMYSVCHILHIKKSNVVSLLLLTSQVVGLPNPSAQET